MGSKNTHQPHTKEDQNSRMATAQGGTVVPRSTGTPC